MPTTAFVITMVDDPERRDRLEAALTSHPLVSVGPASGLRLPIVLQSDDVADDRRLFESLLAHDAVANVEIAFVDQSDLEALPSSQLGLIRGRRPRPQADQES